MKHEIIWKKLPAQLIAYTTAHIQKRDEILPLVESLRAACGSLIAGNPLVIFHGGAVKEGFLVEVAFPVSSNLETDHIHTRMLEEASAYTLIHKGNPQTIREAILKVYDFMNTHAWTTSLFRREVYLNLDAQNPDENLTEVQVIIHEWEILFAEGIRSEMGETHLPHLMQGADDISPVTSFEAYAEWIRAAIDRLDGVTNDPAVKCLVVSHCAHVFPQERIDHLRALYEQNHAIDDVLRDMHHDHFWYEKPKRRGNVLYMRKNPFDPEGYAKAETPAARRKAYCHCPFVHPYLDEIPSKMSTSFCFCGMGWYRRLWEGVLGCAIKISHVETLLKGNDQCTLTITLPFDVTGEFGFEN